MGSDRMVSSGRPQKPAAVSAAVGVVSGNHLQKLAAAVAAWQGATIHRSWWEWQRVVENGKSQGGTCPLYASPMFIRGGFNAPKALSMSSC